MTENSKIPDDASLRAQSHAIVSLAHALVHDEHSAEDVSQDAWVAWLHAPAQRSSEWLRGVLRNLARRSYRDRSRQLQPLTEEQQSVPSSHLPTDEVVEQVALQRDIADALMSIGEPYRTVIVLRFWHDLPPRRIAADLKRPLATIKTQLQRGLVLLRQKLDRHHGREHWIAALVPLVQPSTTTAGITAVIGIGLAMKKCALVLAVLLAVLGLGFVCSPWFDVKPVVLDPRVASEPLTTHRESESSGDRQVVAADVDHSVRERVDIPVASQNTHTADLVGRVMSAAMGQPLVGARVVLTDFGRRAGMKLPNTTTDIGGRFRLTVPVNSRGWPGIVGQGSLNYLSVIDREATLARLVFEIKQEERDQLAKGRWDVGDVALVRGVGLKGHIDSHAGERLSVRASLFVWGEEEHFGDHPLLRARKVGATRSDGSFALDERVGPAAGGRYCIAAVWSGGLAWAQVGVTDGQSDDLTMTLIAMPTESMAVTVMDPDGQPIAGVRVSATARFAPLGYGGQRAIQYVGYPVLQDMFARTTDASGRVEFTHLPGRRDERLLTLAQNGLPDYAIAVRAEGYPPVSLGKLYPREGELREVSITLQRIREVIIEGRILDDDDQPIAGARVYGNGYPFETYSAEDGSYRLLVSLNFHTIIMLVDAEGFQRNFLGVRLHEIEDRSSGHDVKMARLRPLAGVLVDNFGLPVVGARVHLREEGRGGLMPSDEGYTGVDGRFTFRAASDRKLSLGVQPPPPLTLWKRPWERPVGVGGRNVQFVIERDPTAITQLEVEVVDQLSGKPLAVSSATLRTSGKTWADPKRKALRQIPPAVVCSFGKVTSEALPPGHYRLRVVVEGHGWAEHCFEIEANQRRVAERVAVGRPGVIVGTFDFSRCRGQEVVFLRIGPHEQAVSRLPSGKLERVTPNITILRAGKRNRFRFESVTPNKALTLEIEGKPEFGKLEFVVEPGEVYSVVFPPK